MKRRLSIATVFTLLLVVHEQARPQPPVGPQRQETRVSPVDSFILKGDLYRLDGKISEAIDSYREASQEAREMQDQGPDAETRESKADCLLKSGRAYLQIQDLTQGDQALPKNAISYAIEDFQQAIKVGNASQKSVAYVHLADLYMKSDDPTAAIAALENCDRESIPRNQWYVLDYNRARAFDRAGRATEALQAYLQSLDGNPYFVRAADGAVDVTSRILQDDPDQLWKTADKLISLGHSNRAAQLARTILDSDRRPRWPDPVVVDAVAVLCRCWSFQFEQPDKNQLDAIIQQTSRVRVPDLRQSFGAMFFGNLRVNVDSLERFGDHPDLEMSWVRQDGPAGERLRSACSQFITSIAGWFAAIPTEAADERDTRAPPRGSRNGEKALALYLIAWGVDPHNVQAPSGLTTLLNLDGNRALYEDYFDQLVNGIFHAKNEIYKALYDTPPEDESDWLALLQYHIVLGSLFARQGNYGSPEDVTSAVGQWRLALRAEGRAIRLSEGRFSGAPNLHTRIAQYEQTSGDNATAFAAWLKAAERNMDADDLRPAADALANAEKLINSDQQQTQWAATRDRLLGLQNRR